MAAITSAVIVAGASAYAANKSASAQSDAAKKQAQAASAGTSSDNTSTSTTTHGNPEVQGAVQDTLGAAQDLYQQGKFNPVQRRSVASGATPQVTDIANRITAQAENPASNAGVNAANNYIQGVLSPKTGGGSGPPALTDLPPNLQAQVKSGSMSISQ